MSQLRTASSRTTEILILLSLTATAYFQRSSRAECPPAGVLSYDDVVVATGELAADGTVGITECGRFIVAYATAESSNYQVFAARFLPDAGPLDNAPFAISERNVDLYDTHSQFNVQPSIAVSRSGTVHIGWVTRCEECRYPRSEDCPVPPVGPCPEPNDGELIQQSDFPFDNPPSPLSIPIEPGDRRVNAGPSAGRSDGSSYRIAWTNYDRESSCAPPYDTSAL